MSDFVKNLYHEFLQQERNLIRYHDTDISRNFMKSFGESLNNIDKLSDFDDIVFWNQIDYFKNYFNANKKRRSESISAVCNFYRWLTAANTEFALFSNSFTVTPYLLFNSRFVKCINEDYFFTTFDPKNHPGNREKIVFILNGFEKTSSRIKNQHYISINLEGNIDSYYREGLISYILNASNTSSMTSCGQTYYIKQVLEFICELKKQPDYPTPSLKYLTNQEAIIIRKFFNDKNLKISTLNNKIGAARRFFMWMKNTNQVVFDDLFFDYLVQYEEPIFEGGKAIPDEKLALINRYLLDDMKGNPLAHLIYAIFHLALQTEFRISQICNLRIDCIKPSVKKNQYSIESISKTSNGVPTRYAITEMTYHIIMNVIESTEELRENSNIRELSDYIFLYKSQNNRTSVINAQLFTRYLKDACKSLGFKENYTASNLRDTHMTKAFEHILRNGKSDIELSILSRHKKIDTTKSHYIEMELEKMLESTYGVNIHGVRLIDAESKIVDSIPDDNNLIKVENGCGSCKAEKCVLTSTLPCIACNHFITTVKHEVFFKKAIQGIDNLLVNAKTIHDKEDYVTIKTLYVLYLKAIYKHKEGINDN